MIGAIVALAGGFGGLKARLGPLFRRPEPRRQVGLYLDGLVGTVERKTGWQLAEHAGDAAPWRMQAVRGRSAWDADAARDLCRDAVIERLGRRNGVLVKKGTQSVGVGRQYSGTAGRIENCQIGVFLGYASRKGHALIDRWLYLPKDWIEDEARRAKAHVPPSVTFMTKPKIGTAMVEAALDAGVPCAFVLGDSVYGCDKGLRVMLERHETPYVLAVRGNETLRVGDSFASRMALEVARGLDAEDWHRLPAGQARRARGSTIGRACGFCACNSRLGIIGC